MDISIVIPVFNEQRNVALLYHEIKGVVKSNFEVIFVDDGSSDYTLKELKRIQDKNLKIICLRRNFGQSAAMDAGIKHSKGKIIVTMDGDLQNDPKDIPRLVEKLIDFDCVSGWRKKRKDKFLKIILSKIAYLFRSKFIHDSIHDYGCTLKAYKKEALEDVNLFGEMHRFIPALCAIKGFKTTEIVVNHRKRFSGKTKYGFSRLYRGLIDLTLIVLWMKFRPVYFFGALGFLFMLVGGTFSVVFFNNVRLLILSIAILVIGVVLLCTGTLSDMILQKSHFKKMNYSIKEII